MSVVPSFPRNTRHQRYVGVDLSKVGNSLSTTVLIVSGLSADKGSRVLVCSAVRQSIEKRQVSFVCNEKSLGIRSMVALLVICSSQNHTRCMSWRWVVNCPTDHWIGVVYCCKYCHSHWNVSSLVLTCTRGSNACGIKVNDADSSNCFNCGWKKSDSVPERRSTRPARFSSCFVSSRGINIRSAWRSPVEKRLIALRNSFRVDGWI